MIVIEESKKQPKQSEFKIQIRQKSSSIKKRKVKTWSNQQDKLLLQLYSQHPKKWGAIAGLMKDRNQNQCLHRYRRISQFGFNKKIWSVQEDETIIDMVKKIGKNWKLIAQVLGTKTGKQIRQRFINKLDPQIKTSDWSQQQDKIILKYFLQYGSRWSEISKKLKGRPENKIKNRFYSFIQKHYDFQYVNVSSQNQDCQNQILQGNSKVNKSKKQGIKYKNRRTKQTKRQRKRKIDHKIKQIEKNDKNSITIQINGQQNEIKSQQKQSQMMLEHQQKDDIYDQNANSEQKYYLQSLIKVDEYYPSINQNQQRSIRSLVSNNQLQNNNDLFYLGNS